MWRRVMVPEESVPFTFLIGVWGEELMTFSEAEEKGLERICDGGDIQQSSPLPSLHINWD